MNRWRMSALGVGVAVVAVACNVAYDYDGDGHADVAWVTGSGQWFRSGDPDPIFDPGPIQGSNPEFALRGRSLVPGDYDGNHTWEPAVVDNSTVWITGGSRGTFTYASPPNQSQGANRAPTFVVPVPADYDGDGRTDAAWYRQSDASWWIEGQPGPITFGTPHPADHCSLDYSVPVPADYDGDGAADLAVYDPGPATFAIRGQADPVALGEPYDIPAVADYDGDGRADLAVVHLTDSPGDATFLVAGREPIDAPDDLTAGSDALPASANYDGAGGAEPAVAYTSGVQSQVWIAGAGLTAIAGDSTAVAAALTMTSPQLSFGRRHACDGITP